MHQRGLRFLDEAPFPGLCCPGKPLQEIGPYMLRREKKDVFKPAEAGDGQQGTALPVGAAEAGPSGTSSAAKPATMPHKNDLIVWLKLKPMQRRVYQAFLNSGELGTAGCWYVH